MSYKIKNKKQFHKQFRKRLLNQVDAAIQEIQDGSMPFDKKIHQARKRFKKIRGLLRLGMKTLGKKRYKEENSRFREYGHRLAHARDSNVYLKTLNSVAEDSVDKRKIKGLKQALEEEYNPYSFREGCIEEPCQRLAEKPGGIFRNAIEKTWQQGFCKRANPCSFARRKSL